MSDRVKTILYGLTFAIIGAGFWYLLIGDPIDEYKIMRSGKNITAKVESCFQDVAEDDKGHGSAYEDCAFSYSVNGAKYFGHEKFPQVVETVDIIYLPENPAIHRPKQGAATGLFDWLFRKCLLGLILLGMFTAPGLGMIYKGWKDEPW